MSTIIIGAGASGLACAVRLKQRVPGCDITIIERLSQPAKKILATGNGRCNLSNIKAQHSKEVIDFFSQLGIVTRTDDEGRIYPYSNQAATVADILINKCRELGIKIITECEVICVTDKLCVKTTQGNFNADNIVIAAGAMAQKSLGSNGSGFELLKALGHTITPLSPALVQLTSPSKYPRRLKGHRVKCNMSILLDNQTAGSEYGEVLFTDYGLSGIVTMNLSYIVSKNFNQPNPLKCHAVLDLVPELSEQDLLKHIKKFGSLQGILGSRFSDIIEKQANKNDETQAKLAKNWKLIINGTKGFDFAQITDGGAELCEFNNYESTLVGHIFACGEILNKQFPCGGFNLNFAWYSGIKTADRIADIYEGN